MRKRFGIKTLFVITAVISIVLAASVALRERTNKFAGSFRQPEKVAQKQLMVDAKLENTRLFFTNSAWHKIVIEDRSIVDCLLFRKYCKVTFTTSEEGNGSWCSSFNCTNTYKIDLFGIDLIDSNDRWVMTVDY